MTETLSTRALAARWLGALLAATLLAGPATPADAAPPPRIVSGESLRLQTRAQAVTIRRDDWGIPHIHGHSDADAVFGMIYAQCEDDYARVEANVLGALGWRARVEGAAAIWADLRQQLWMDHAALKRDYTRSPGWLQQLMQAWADGLNWYLASHPDLHPGIAHYQPWMALSFTEGSIGGDIERADLAALARFYGADPATAADLAASVPASWADPTGSNGIAIAPALSVSGHALLLINPHTSFYFRSEAHMSSDAGLDAYGASTWGQFFIYQGFNRHTGWMHTSTGADAVDEFAETIVSKAGRYFYRYGEQLLPVATRDIGIEFRQPDGSMGTRRFTARFTRHGPIVRDAGDPWIALALMHKPVAALQQSWLRTRTKNLAAYMRVAALQANSSNNTVFADDQGNIAFLMPQFIPRRDDRYDYTRPVDGSNPATAWQGATPLADLPHVINPPNGWVFNTNDWPWSAAGAHSPQRASYPRYMDNFGENPRGVHAAKLLAGAGQFSSAKLIELAFDPALPAFARLLPILLRDYDALPADAAMRARLAGPIAVLRDWDTRWGPASIATTLAVTWGDRLWDSVAEVAAHHGDPYRRNMRVLDYMADPATAQARLEALASAVQQLQADHGHWGVPWAAFNRHQRLDARSTPHFDDAQASIGVPFTSSRWGSLASFGAHRWPGTTRYYGNSGNSFVAVVEFGPQVGARAIHVGGQSGHPDSPHFSDQAQAYAYGNLRPVRFRPDQIERHTQRRYHPGE